MRETKFIEQNQKKWQDFEQILEKGTENPEELNRLYIQITDDLSYARTFYPNRSVRVYLNGLAQRVFTKIHKNKQSFRGRFVHFWKDELPQLIYESRNAFRLSFFVFLFSLAIGMLSSAMDPDFVGIILGEDYVEMTLKNIESGDPMAVYKDSDAFGMTLGITLNNLWVSLIIFVFGALFSIGSIIPIISNGVMVGAFQYFFISEGLFWASFLTIWIHGTLEISAMVIAGAAGMTMGRGLVFPGNFSRAQAFQQSARRGIKILVGIVPIVILAGTLEGYLTRHTETPDIVRGFFILACLAFVLTYFVWYPWMRGRQGFENKVREARLKPDGKQLIDFQKIKTSGFMMGDVFVFLRKNIGFILLISIAGSVLFTGGVFVFANRNPEVIFYYPTFLFGTVSILDGFFTSRILPYIPLLMGANMTLLYFLVFNKLRDETPVSPIAPRGHLFNFLKVLTGALFIGMILWMGSALSFISLFLICPIILLWIFIAQHEQISLSKSFKRTQKLLQGNYGKVISLFTMLFLSGLFFFSLADTALVGFLFQALSWVIPFEQETMNNVTVILQTFLSILFLNLLIINLAVGIGISYYSLLESNDAAHLMDKIKDIGLKRQIKGLERE